MTDASQLKKFLDALGLSALEQFVDTDLAKELEAEIAGLGGVDAVLEDKLPAPPPPQPNAALGFPDPPIAAGDITYACSDDENGTVRQVPSLEVTTRVDVMDGMPVWRTRWKVDDHGLALEHEEIVRAADLRLLRHRGGSQFFRVSAFVAHDEVHVSTEMVTGKIKRESRKVRLPETAFTILPGLWAALAAAPIDRGWSTLVHLDRKITKDQWRYLSVRLDVAGEERIVTPAGTFDCWVIDARGASGEPEVNDRYWVSRGDPFERVVARAHEWQPLEGSTRRYELARMRRPPGDAGDATARPSSMAPVPPAEPPPPAVATLELLTRDPYVPSVSSIPMKRGTPGIPPEEVRRLVAESMERVPTIERLRAEGKAHDGTPAEAIARYERERAEYEEDRRARIEMHEAWVDHHHRRRNVQAVVRLESDQARATHVRLTVPPGVGIALLGEDGRIEDAHPPLPLTATLDKRRRRFVARIEPTHGSRDAKPPAERFTAPDGSTVVIFGPAPASRTSPMYFSFTFAFASWEEVKPFTLAWDIAAEGLPSVTGSLRIGTHVVERDT